MAEIKGTAARARQRVDRDSRAFNVALWRIATGKPGPGGICRELAAVTGLSPDSIRGRVSDAAHDYPPAPIAPGANMTADDLDYRAAIYHAEGAAETREFFSGLNGGQRPDPNHERARVARQRVGGRLISVSIGSRNN